jgi:hypothetical protein
MDRSDVIDKRYGLSIMMANGISQISVKGRESRPGDRHHCFSPPMSLNLTGVPHSMPKLSIGSIWCSRRWIASSPIAIVLLQQSENELRHRHSACRKKPTTTSLRLTWNIITEKHQDEENEGWLSVICLIEERSRYKKKTKTRKLASSIP